MSLINKMLRDLDARHAPAVDRTALPSAVHVLQPQRRLPSQAPLVLTFLLVAAGAWIWLGMANAPVPVPVSPAPPTPVAAPSAPATSVAMVQDVAAPTPASAVAPVSAPAVVAPEARAVTPASATKPPPPKPSVGASIALPKAAPKDASAPKPAATHPPETKAVAVAAQSPAAAEPPAASPSSIDRHARNAAANDAGENEYRKAMAALRRGANGEAMEGLQAALRADKHHHSARQALLSLMVEKQQWGDAQTVVEEGLAVDPTQTGWAVILARLQLEGGKLADARETLARHAAYAEQNADYQAFFALVLQRMKRFGEAAARYRAAVGLKPAEGRWWYGLGLSLEADQKPQEAREAFLKAREAGTLPPELTSAVEQRLR